MNGDNHAVAHDASPLLLFCSVIPGRDNVASPESMSQQSLRPNGSPNVQSRIGVRFAPRMTT